MKSTEMSVGGRAPAADPCPPNPMERITVKVPSRRMQRAVAHVEALGEALASGQRASTGARLNFARHTETDAGVAAIALQRELAGVPLFHTGGVAAVAGLPDRTSLLDRLNHVLVRAERQQRQVAVLLRDLDGFLDIDARLGHPAAGRLLARTAERLLSCLQGGDSTFHRDGCDFISMPLAFDGGMEPLPTAAGNRRRAAGPTGGNDPTIVVAAGAHGRRQDREGPAAQRLPWKRPEFCLSAGLGPETASQVERLLNQRVRFRKGDVLYRVGSGFHALYAIRAGSCKTVLLARDGRDLVAGYHMAGDIIGMDGIGTDTHGCDATALEDLEVCPLPFDEVEILTRQSDPFRRNLHRLLSREGQRAQALMIVLGTMRAEQRLAAFLLDLSQRYQERGYSPCEFVLRLTREEIGSHLGLKLETVSRLFSRFQREGLIQVQGRTVKLLDRHAVGRLVDCTG